jgi:hypothetical protein
VKSKKGFYFCVLFLCAAFVFPASSWALIVPLEDSGWALVIGPNSGEVSVVVDMVTNDAVYIQLGKTFDSVLEGELFGPIIVEFQKISAAATSNIVICDEFIVNDTGTEWFDFHISLPVNLLEPEAGFDPAFVPDGDQLEDVFYSWEHGYQGLPTELNFLNMTGGGVVSSPLDENVFRPGYFGGQIVIKTNPALLEGARFGLKEIPTIPEPVTLSLFGISLLLTISRKRRFA